MEFRRDADGRRPLSDSEVLAWRPSRGGDVEMGPTLPTSHVFRRALRWILAVSIGLAALLIVWTELGLGRFHVRVVLTFLGLAVAAPLLDLQLGVKRERPQFVLGGLAAIILSQVFYLTLVWTGWRPYSVQCGLWLTSIGFILVLPLADYQLRFRQSHPKVFRAGLAALLLSLACFLLLVWTGWRTDTVLWRLWWLSLWTALTLSYLLALSALPDGRIDPYEKWTSVCVSVLGIFIGCLALRRDLLAEVSGFHLLLIVVAACGAIAGSSVVWGRWLRRQSSTLSVSRRARIGWLILSYFAIFAAGLYIGHRSAERATTFELMPSALASMSPREIEDQVQADLARLKTVIAGIENLEERWNALDEQLRGTFKAEGRKYYSPEEDDQVRWHFVTYLSYRSVLHRMIATYSGFVSVRDPRDQARCFLLGFGAAMTVSRVAIDLVHRYRDLSVARKKLNEAEPAWGVPAGMFDRIYENVTAERNVELCEEMAAYFEHHRKKWRLGRVLPDADFDWIERRIARGIQHIRENRPESHRTQLDLFLERVKQDAYTPVYAVQSMVASWIGDTRIVKRAPFVSIKMIHEFQKQLKPGDIILERRNWFLSNAFLPGFWPHAALYVGGVEDLRRLGVADHPEVVKRLDEYLEKAADGEPHTVIESVSEGVVFSSLVEATHADYIAVLRPRLPEEKIAEAITRAFRHQGKPYDFEFDFFTSDKLVCTELVYRSYEGMLHFDLVQVMGRDTLPALEIVRKFAKERDQPDRDLDFVFFLDGDAAMGQARYADAGEFCASVDRPRAFNE